MVAKNYAKFELDFYSSGDCSREGLNLQALYEGYIGNLLKALIHKSLSFSHFVSDSHIG